MFAELLSIARERIDDRAAAELGRRLLEANREALLTLPAATHNHHAFVGGYLEHVLSVTRTCVYLADKYDDYYPDMQPRLNKGLVVAGAILHDIGKLREIEERPQGAEYTAAGNLIGHILQGRDIVREAAAGSRARRRGAAAAGAHHRRPPAAARMGLAQAADDSRSLAGPLRRRHGRQISHDGRHFAGRHEPRSGDVEEERALSEGLSRAGLRRAAGGAAHFSSEPRTAVDRGSSAPFSV